MPILLVGLNYRTTLVAERERLALRAEESRAALAASPALDEVAILATCNRFEVYACVSDCARGSAAVAAALHAVGETTLDAHLLTWEEDAAVEHLLRVACGLQSMVLGEAQILGQVTQAFEQARAEGASGPILSHLFAAAIHAGKRARSETPISRHTTSVSHAAAAMLRADLLAEGVTPARVLIVGAGEMAALAAHALYKPDRDGGTVDLAFVNRTFGRAAALAQGFGGTVKPWDEMVDALAWADGVLVATSADRPLIDTELVASALPARGGRPLFMVDIAVPRNVDPAVAALPRVLLADIDALRLVIDANLERRRAAAPLVDTIVRAEAEEFARWLAGRQVAPVITILRAWAQEIAAEELARALHRVPDADPRTQETLQRLAHRLVNRLLHAPSTQLRTQAFEGHAYGYSQAVRALFDLEQAPLPCRCGNAPSGEEAFCTLRCIAPPESALP